MSIPSVDKELFDRMSRDELYDYMHMQIRNIWRVDGLYFLGIEKRHSMDEATDVDAECWQYMGKVEAKELKSLLRIENPDPAQALLVLRHTSWAVSHDMKSFGVDEDGSARFIVDSCRTQKIRTSKGLDEHPCRQVREGYLEAFLKECNPDLTLETVSCPPDRTRNDVYCEWVFRNGSKK